MTEVYEAIQLKKIRVEFKYFDRNTCSRCKTTDENVEKTVKNLREALAEEGVKVELKTTKLPAGRIAESNSVLLNGVDIEEIVNKKRGGSRNERFTVCRGCAELIDEPCNCRAYSYRGRKYRFIPKAMIREAIRKLARL